jgi:hypothetical protein
MLQMGQYWIIINITKGQWIDCYHFLCSKMMEFAWIGNSYLLAIDAILSPGGLWHGDKVWFEGDYNIPNSEVNTKTNLYHLARESWESIVPNGLSKHHRYVVNQTKKTFVDLEKSTLKYNGLRIHPMPILLSCSSGGGGGDYGGNDAHLVGHWVGDVVYTDDTVPDGYAELTVYFTDGIADPDEPETEDTDTGTDTDK